MDTHYEFRVYKSRDGWEAKTEIELPDAGERRFLRISTHKTPGGISTSAVVVKRIDTGFQWDVFGDFRVRLALEPGRATENKIREVHLAALAKVPAILPDAIAFYQKSAA